MTVTLKPIVTAVAFSYLNLYTVTHGVRFQWLVIRATATVMLECLTFPYISMNKTRTFVWEKKETFYQHCTPQNGALFTSNSIDKQLKTLSKQNLLINLPIMVLTPSCFTKLMRKP